MGKDISDTDVISIKELFLTIKSYLMEIVKKWWVIALIALPMCLYFWKKTTSIPIKYSASLRYVVEGSGGSMGGLGGLLGSFGIGGGSKNGINPFQVLEVTKSRGILDKVLLDTSSYNSELIINNIISEYKLDEKWAENNPERLGYRFTTNDVSQFTDLDNAYYKAVLGKVLGSAKNRSEALLIPSQHDEFGIYKIFSSTVNENLSIDIAKKTYENVKEFYEEGMLENQRNTRDILELKKDSLKAVIDSKAYQLAQVRDRSRGAVSLTLAADESKIQREIAGLSLAYQEVYKSFEVADYTFKNNQPFFATIDVPFKPLTMSAQSLLINLAMALILSGILGSILICGNKLIRDNLS